MAIKRNTANTANTAAATTTSTPSSTVKKVIVKKPPVKVEEEEVIMETPKKIVKKAASTTVEKKPTVKKTVKEEKRPAVVSEKKPVLTKAPEKSGGNTGKPSTPTKQPNGAISREYFVKKLKARLNAAFDEVEFSSNDAETIYKVVSDTILNSFREGGKTLVDPNNIVYKLTRIAPRMTNPPRGTFKNTFVGGYDLLTVRFPMSDFVKINGEVNKAKGIFIAEDGTKYQLEELLKDDKEETVVSPAIEEEDTDDESVSESENDEEVDENSEEEVSESDEEEEEEVSEEIEEESEENDDSEEEEYEEEDEDEDEEEFELEDED